MPGLRPQLGMESVTLLKAAAVFSAKYRPKTRIYMQVILRLCVHLIVDKRGKIYNGEKTISLTSGAGKTGQPAVVKE